MSEILLGIGVLFIFFQNIILNQFPGIEFIGYWDEAVTLFLLAIYIMFLARKSWKLILEQDIWKMIVCIVCIVVIGLIGNIAYGYVVSVDSIFRDIVGFMKFPLSFIIIRAAHFDRKLAAATSRYAVPIFKVVIIGMFFGGIISLFWDIGLSQVGELRHGIVPYRFLFSHPTYLVLCNIMMLAVLNMTEKENNWKFEIMIVGNIILSMRTKGAAVVAVYIFIKYSGAWLKRVKVIYWFGVIIVVTATGYSKLQEYMSFSNSPRESLYRGAFILMKKCFPVGSGFATYASHLSGKTDSKVYNFISLAGVWKANGAGASIGDTGYPYYMGQFGIVGFILFIYLMFLVYRIITKNVESNLSSVLFFYIIIALTTETILINNGLELGMTLAMLDKLQIWNYKKMKTFNIKGNKT